MKTADKDPKNTIRMLSAIVKHKTKAEYLRLHNALFDCAITGT